MVQSFQLDTLLMSRGRPFPSPGALDAVFVQSGQWQVIVSQHGSFDVQLVKMDTAVKALPVVRNEVDTSSDASSVVLYSCISV